MAPLGHPFVCSCLNASGPLWMTSTAAGPGMARSARTSDAHPGALHDGRGNVLRPMVNPGLRRIWRDPATVQFGVDVPEAVLLCGIDDSFAALLERLDGSIAAEAFVDLAVAQGHPRASVTHLMSELERAGALIDATTWPGGLPLTSTARARLAPDLAAAALTSGPGLGPAERCRRLAETVVTVYGLARLGAITSTLLTASGIGAVNVIDDRTVRPQDVSVGGFSFADVGQSRSSLVNHIRQWNGVEPSLTTTSASNSRLHHVAVVTDAVDSRRVAEQLSAVGTPHLVVSSAESVGRIGPLVIPGETPCLRCHDLTRTDGDPGWPQVVVQLGDTRDEIAGDSNLTTATAATATLHLTSWLCGGAPPSLAGFSELRLPHGDHRDHLVPFHPSCGCTWPSKVRQDTMAK